MPKKGNTERNNGIRKKHKGKSRNQHGHVLVLIDSFCSYNPLSGL